MTDRVLTGRSFYKIITMLRGLLSLECGIDTVIL